MCCVAEWVLWGQQCHASEISAEHDTERWTRWYQPTHWASHIGSSQQNVQYRIERKLSVNWGGQAKPMFLSLLSRHPCIWRCAIVNSAQYIFVCCVKISDTIIITAAKRIVWFFRELFRQFAHRNHRQHNVYLSTLSRVCSRLFLEKN